MYAIKHVNGNWYTGDDDMTFSKDEDCRAMWASPGGLPACIDHINGNDLCLCGSYDSDGNADLRYDIVDPSETYNTFAHVVEV